MQAILEEEKPDILQSKNLFHLVPTKASVTEADPPPWPSDRLFTPQPQKLAGVNFEDQNILALLRLRPNKLCFCIYIRALHLRLKIV